MMNAGITVKGHAIMPHNPPLETGVVTMYRPARKRARVYSARDVGRIVAYARNDGANDTLLIAYILQSFGLKKIECLLFKILDILNTAVFLSAILLLLKGISGLIKLSKLLVSGRRSRLTLNLIEQFWPTRFTKSLAAYIAWVSSAELAIGTLMIFITAIANNVALYLLAKGVCEAEVQDLNVVVKPLQVHTLFDDINAAVKVLESVISDNL